MKLVIGVPEYIIGKKNKKSVLELEYTHHKYNSIDTSKGDKK